MCPGVTGGVQLSLSSSSLPPVMTDGPPSIITGQAVRSGTDLLVDVLHFTFLSLPARRHSHFMVGDRHAGPRRRSVHQVITEQTTHTTLVPMLLRQPGASQHPAGCLEGCGSCVGFARRIHRRQQLPHSSQEGPRAPHCRPGLGPYTRRGTL